MSSTEFFDSERLEWLTLRCRSPFGPGTEDIHLFKVIDQLMACEKTFLFTCCGFFSQFIVSQAMQSLQYGEYSLIVLYNNIIIYLIIYYNNIYIIIIYIIIYNNNIYTITIIYSIFHLIISNNNNIYIYNIMINVDIDIYGI